MQTSATQKSGLVLLAAAAGVAVTGFVLGAGYDDIGAFFLLPLLTGVGFLAAAAVGGARVGLWPTALTTTGWGLLIQLHFHGIIPPSPSSPAEPVSIAIYAVSAVVAGALAYVLIRRLRLRGRLRAVTVVVLASLGIYALALSGVPGVVGWWLYPVLMVAVAVPLLRARPRVAA